MRDLLLIAAVVAQVFLGWHFIGKLDVFLANSIQDAPPADLAGGDFLRIGCSDPLAADSLSGSLESYSRQHPDTAVSLFSGTEAELLHGLSTGKLDMIFLPETTAVPEWVRVSGTQVSLEPRPVVTRPGGLSVGPVTEGRRQYKVVWPKEQKTKRSSAAGSFVRCLQAGILEISSDM